MTQTATHYADDTVCVYKTVVGSLSNNVFIVQCVATKRSVLIDAASNGELLVELAEKYNVELVLTTHGHWDHVGAVPQMQRAGHKVGIGPQDAVMLEAHDFPINDGDLISVGNLEIEALNTPGHTPGSTCFYVRNTPLLFTGDTLFPGGPGATSQGHSSFDDIMNSLRTNIFGRFDDDTIALPGHGADTTLGTERPHLDEWAARGW